MMCPYTIMTKWMHHPWPIQPVLEDYSIAQQMSNRVADGEIGADEAALPGGSLGHRRSVVIGGNFGAPKAANVRRIGISLVVDGDDDSVRGTGRRIEPQPGHLAHI
jgi:hypothetical protein